MTRSLLAVEEAGAGGCRWVACKAKWGAWEVAGVLHLLVAAPRREEVVEGCNHSAAHQAAPRVEVAVE
jgi:hypothetical protein